MNIRHPVRGGSFYESSAVSCRHHADKLLESVELPSDLPQERYGGLVPHAGWMYSGALAAKTFKALAAAEAPQTVVLLGADHVGTVTCGEVYDSGVWRTPLGEVRIDEDLAAAIVGSSELLRANPDAHAHEHSIEVQVPLLQAMSDSVRIVPIAIPPTGQAVEIGQAIGTVLTERFLANVANPAGSAVKVVGSTDLTHHGGHFPAPGGRGEAGVQWTRQNDRRMLDLIEAMEAEKVVEEADTHSNACGAGAIAATVAACRQMGATRGICLEYTNSYEVIHAIYPNDPDDTTVGYSSVVFV